MQRFTVDRSAIKAEVERRNAAAPVSPAPVPAASVPKPARWSAKVFVVPAAVAEALARFAHRTFSTPVTPPGEPHSMRRHRGVYIWRPTMDQASEESLGDIENMPDVSTAELEISKLSKRNDVH
ncbi:MAG TPA: hypothetical protein VEB19_16110 [Gemmatimonadaceae bacterium]|nr:hypothetical protein [Gemmatimonadaceae bacterium]